MSDATVYGLQYFAPQNGRSYFFSEWASVNGVHNLDGLDSISAIMQNTPRTLVSSYAPLRKRKLAQQAMNERAQMATWQFPSRGLNQSESGPSHGGNPSAPDAIVEQGSDDES